MTLESYEKICLVYTKEKYGRSCPPRRYQKIVWEKFLGNLEKKKPTLVRLPCGYGKTLIGLAPFIAQASDDDWKIAPRLIYVLPMRSLANQVRDVAKEIVKITKEKIGISVPLVVKMLHGEAWETPHLFSDICITTLDSFLYSYARKVSIDSAYGNGHVDFSAGSIANSMVVFDEAHMYQGGDIQLLGLFRIVIEQLVNSGIPMIIMTATMPKVIREYIFEDISYDDISFKDDEVICNKRYDVFQPIQNDVLDVDVKNFITTLNYKKLLIVTNTVEKAIRVCAELKDHNPILLHARIRNADKNRRLEDAKKRLQEGDIILVSTQVCEAGLDLSFDTLVTEIAPADSLVQRIGRVARNGGKGSVVFCKPRTDVPYEGDIMDATWNWINLHLSELDFSRFSSANGVYGVQEFVDECWTSYGERFERFPSESELFLREKGLISEPDLEFNVRGTQYVVIVAPYEGGKSLLNGVAMKSDEFDSCKFSVNLDMIKKHIEWVKHQDNGSLYVMKYDSKCQGYVAHRESELKPYRSYLCNSSFYSDEFGLGTYGGRD
jgi:CRISPR-associated endonuclease/helicase Cas3